MRNLLILLFAVFIASCANRHQETVHTEPEKTSEPVSLSEYPKNIILMIGDGMGLTQITAGMYINGNKLHMERFPVTGLHKSHAYNNLITDSAAGATAFSCGVKTYNGAIGVTPDTLPCKTILELAEERGMASGLVVTSTIVHATPASFFAHVKSRHDYEDIAEFLFQNEMEILIGGGEKYFSDRKKDNRNLIDELKNKGYNITRTDEEMPESFSAAQGRRFISFTGEEDPKKVSEGRTYLPDASAKAAYFLKNFNSDGFFLLIEGSQIDWGGHANDSDYIINEMIDFDNAIGRVLDFAEADGETLVIVTADHETGGYAINPGSTMDKIEAGFTSKSHTGTLIPVFAYGPGSELFGGIYDNTRIFDKMRAALRMGEPK